jgi:hypothetical protein
LSFYNPSVGLVNRDKRLAQARRAEATYFAGQSNLEEALHVDNDPIQTKRRYAVSPIRRFATKGRFAKDG